MKQETKSNFHLYDDKGNQLKKDMSAIGFTKLKMWEQPCTMYYEDGQDYWNRHAVRPVT